MTHNKFPTPMLVSLQLAGLLQLCGCTTLENLRAVTDPSLLSASSTLPAYTDGEASVMPKIRTTLGKVWADSCRYRYNRPSVGQQASLAQLRARTAMKGANGIAHLRFMLITNNKSPCWHGFEASGVAVVFDSVKVRASLP